MRKFIQKVFAFVMTMWHKGKKFLNEHIAPSMDLVEKIKQVVNSPEADLVTKLFPGTWDDMALAWVRSVLPTAATLTGIIATCAPIEEPAAFIKCLSDEIKKLPESERPGKYRDLASYLSLEKAKAENYEHDLTMADVNFTIELEHIKRQANA